MLSIYGSRGFALSRLEAHAINHLYSPRSSTLYRRISSLSNSQNRIGNNPSTLTRASSNYLPAMVHFPSGDELRKFLIEKHGEGKNRDSYYLIAGKVADCFAKQTMNHPLINERVSDLVATISQHFPLSEMMRDSAIEQLIEDLKNIPQKTS